MSPRKPNATKAIPAPSLEELQKALRAQANPEKAKSSAWFFKTGPGEYGEGDRFLGVTVPQIRQLVREFKDATLQTALELLHSPWHEDRLFALLLLVRQYERGDEPARRKVGAAYLRHLAHVNNWDLVDSSAPPILGASLQQADWKRLLPLAKSKNLWRRRVAIIATQSFIRRGIYDPTLQIAEILLDDSQDLIHKATGWMLREVGERERALLLGFLETHMRRMPRTMLRYAIEKLPANQRREILKESR